MLNVNGALILMKNKHIKQKNNIEFYKLHTKDLNP